MSAFALLDSAAALAAEGRIAESASALLNAESAFHELLGAAKDALSYADAYAVIRGGEANELRHKLRKAIAGVES